MYGGNFKSISTLVSDTATALGVADPGNAGTTMLTRDGFCIGRRYRFNDVEAEWLLKENVIRFYGKDRCLLKTVPVQRLEEGSGPVASEPPDRLAVGKSKRIANSCAFPKKVA